MVLPSPVETDSHGPRSKSPEGVFYNPAMSGSRTRSVLVLKHAIEQGLVGKGEI